MSTPPKQRRGGTFSQFVFGGLSGMGATSIVQPIDLIKTRLQLAGEAQPPGARPPAAVPFIRNIIRQEGFFGLYNGLSAALLRQMTYTTGRLGMFQYLKKLLHDERDGPMPMYKRALAGLGAGATGAIIGNPAEICMIRMMADGRLPAAERRGYKHTGDALVRIVGEEGVMRLWRGSGPTIARAMLLNMAQLGAYDQAKQNLMETGYFRDNIWLHLTASTFSGLLATTVSMPADMAKTRLQNMKAGPDGTVPYKGTADVLVKVVRSEGVLALWRGFVPYWLRLGQHTVYTFIIFEQINAAYSKYLSKDG